MKLVGTLLDDPALYSKLLFSSHQCLTWYLRTDWFYLPAPMSSSTDIGQVAGYSLILSQGRELQLQQVLLAGLFPWPGRSWFCLQHMGLQKFTPIYRNLTVLLLYNSE